MAGWIKRSRTQVPELVTLADGVTGQLRIVYGRDGMVTLQGRDIVMPGAGLVADLPVAAVPAYAPAYGLLGRTGSRVLATFDVSTVSGAPQLVQGTSHTSALYFTIAYPRKDI